MKIAVRGGHNFSVPGASGIISETKEDRRVKDSLIKYLRAGGHSVLDVTAPDSCNTINSDLAYGVRKANEWGADLFISCHFNNCYSHYDGAIGTEVWVYNDFDEAKKALAGLASIGFKNRGIKHSTGLYELRATNM
ncbi:N-acetylmuramoyl-L-alanine amidase, partial [Arthrospira platensis SPKY2]